MRQRPFLRAFLLVPSAMAAASCRPPPAQESAGPVIPRASATVLATASAAPTVTPVAPVQAAALVERLASAYAMRAHGDVVRAGAAFDELRGLLAAAGDKEEPGLGHLDFEVVRGRTRAGITVRDRGAHDTWFFDIATGEPFAFVPRMELKRGAPSLDASYFVTADSNEPRALFEPVSSTFAELPGNLIAVHPDGHTAYVLGEDCRVHGWNIAKGELATILAAHAPRTWNAEEGRRLECEPYSFKDAAITPDGRWLSTRFGRWNLKSGVHRSLPCRFTRNDYAPAISPDGKYAACVTANPKAPGDIPGLAEVLALYDLDAGVLSAMSEPMSALVNGDPLSFGSHPARVCIFDYGFYAFKVPSLRRFQAGDNALLPETGPLTFGSHSCETKFVRPPPEHADLAARLASRVCTVGGYLIPIEHCASPAGPR